MYVNFITPIAACRYTLPVTPVHSAAASTLVVETVENVVGHAPRPIALHEPRFGPQEKRYVDECVDTNWVSSVGAFVDRFERDLAAYTGAGFAVATSNGTAALHIALLLAGVQPGDEVIIPALTFIATANAVSYCSARPHLVDADPQTLGLDPAKLENHLRTMAIRHAGGWVNKSTGARIAAIVPMHTYGHPVDLDGCVEVAKSFGIPLVEDAAESLGSFYRGRHTGTFGRVNTLSFNGNKIVTTGGGGAILTNDAAIAQHAKHLTTTAKKPHAWAFEHDEVGFNYRLPNLNAALGCAQLERLDEFLTAKRILARRYADAFADSGVGTIVLEPAETRSNYWLITLLLNADLAFERNAILAALHERRILARPAWNLMHTLPMYADCPRADLTTAEDLAQRMICLPSSPHLLAPG